MFTRGTLWRHVTETSERALQSGALLPIPTAHEFVADGGIEFLVRIVTNLARKQKRDAPLTAPTHASRNPFLPYDPTLYVADASESHVCLLNKFNVVDHHLLIVTKQFQSQDAPLNLADFSALGTCMAEYEGLGFYNAGQVAGASQAHKHLQLVPLPLAPRGPAVPVEPLLDNAERQGEVARCTKLPFPHALGRLEPRPADGPERAAERSLSLYRAMMKAIGLTAGTSRTGNYNLLITRRWMLLVPRYVETVESASLNALAFAGALLVRDARQLERLRRRGPMAALARAATPPNGAAPA
jgi:ATP adenylyltransferase